MPALAAGAFRYGILAVAVVQVVIAVLFLVPWCLTRLKHLAIRPRATGTGFAVPVFGGTRPIRSGGICGRWCT